MMKRKGQGLILADIIALFVLFLILAGFWFALKLPELIPGREEQVIEGISRENSQINLLNFLRSSVEIEGRNIETSELISLAYTDKNLEEPLREKVKEIFPKVYGDCYGFFVYDKEKLIFQEGLSILSGEPMSINVILPLENKENLIIELNPTYFFELGKNALQTCGVT
ncbi:hypothetical protein HYT51_00420 [Candidatus Woesearchaeota archaeon]|nr:hypothetical protein [Candidatus Woesearchaeota archaeon]